MLRLKTISGALAASCIAIYSFAADSSENHTSKVPTSVGSAFNWSGVYLGIDSGYSSSRTTLNNVTSDGNIGWPDLAPGEGIGYRQSGSLIGIQTGINMQKGILVYGFELSCMLSDGSGAATTVPGFPYSAGDDVFKTKINNVLVATGRIGLAVDRSLFYAKAGVATASIRTSVHDSVGSLGSGDDNHRRSGFTVGSGWEYALTDKIIGGFEYDYIRLGGGSVNLGDSAARYVFNSSPYHLQNFLARLSYKF